MQKDQIYFLTFEILFFFWLSIAWLHSVYSWAFYSPLRIRTFLSRSSCGLWPKRPLMIWISFDNKNKSEWLRVKSKISNNIRKNHFRKSREITRFTSMQLTMYIDIEFVQCNFVILWGDKIMKIYIKKNAEPSILVY